MFSQACVIPSVHRSVYVCLWFGGGVHTPWTHVTGYTHTHLDSHPWIQQLTSGRYASCWNAFLLPAATKLGQGNVFTGVCDSVHRGGVSASVHAGIPPPRSRHPPSRHPPRADTPPKTRPPLGADTPQDQTPPRSRHPTQRPDPPRNRHPPWSRHSPRTRHPPGSRLLHTVNERPVRINWNAFLFANNG